MLTFSTRSGRELNLLDIASKDIDIHDIANALSKLCRYSGQCNRFFSVAQHSLLVAEFVSEEFKLRALLHDASEAYLGDMTAPVKQYIPNYRLLESAVTSAIEARFGVPFEGRDVVHAADIRARVAEMRLLMPKAQIPDSHIGYGVPCDVTTVKLFACSEAHSRHDFLEAFRLYCRHEDKEL